MNMQKKNTIDMTHGSLWNKLLLFALPLAASSILQQLFNSVDTAVVGRFASSRALAAVGSNSSLIALMINLFIGISLGSNVIISRYIGQKAEEHVKGAIHTAIVVALCSGIFVLVLGQFIARPVLTLMGTPKDVLDLAVLYLRIYFLGMPFIMLYDFSSSILRSIGDSRRPLYALIVAGGTGFYIQSLLYDIDFSKEESDTAYRTELTAFAKEYGAHALHEKLKEIDPVSYETIHENNIKRVIRALEFYHQNHTPISAHNEKEHQKTSPYRFAYFVLTDEREKLYRRIDQRVDLMMEQGLLTEVKTLYDMGCRKDMVSMQGLGYKEILDYLDGSCSLEEAVYVIKRETRHFAKRQLTWFRREKDVIWLDKSEFNDREDQMLQKMTDVLHEKGIIQ